ncbi:SPFH domain-containing protein [Candidatus Woesearchaeota archaeon]|nr:SPFH domain-containing protein [Candidatus Woesearchaeota archaeon]
MGFVSEFVDLVGKFKFSDTVYEYQQGLYVRMGTVIGKKKKLSPEEEKKAWEKEQEEIRIQGSWKFVIPFCYPRLSSDFKRDFLTGRPLHSSRFNRILPPGFYFHLPFLEEIVKESKQERVLNLGNITVPTVDEDSKSIIASCNLRYELKDIYLAYTAVHDYEDSLRDHTLSILAKHSRGKKFAEWKNPDVIEELEIKVQKDLEEIVTHKWGLEIHEVYITDNVPCHTTRLTHDGQPITINNLLKQADGGADGYMPS